VNANRIVSSESEELILVDKNDIEIGSLSKAQCHDGDGILHRAFSLFIFNPDGELLLQKRSGSKRLWPLVWSNSCCSHPRKGESMDVAIGRRLEEELGLSTTLEFVYKFSYQARYGEFGSENELCSVFLGRCNQEVRINQSEIAACRFINPRDLVAEISVSDDRFTPWFRMEWRKLEEEFADKLAKYSSATG
jgi:isopentenyl-diphosphate delta-isomerase